MQNLRTTLSIQVNSVEENKKKMDTIMRFAKKHNFKVEELHAVTMNIPETVSYIPKDVLVGDTGAPVHAV